MKFPFFQSKVVVSGTDTIPFESFFQELRQTEYSRLDETGQVYLDFKIGRAHV